VSEPWFDPNRYAWIPGTLLGVMGGLLGSLAGVLAPRGKAKGLVVGLFVATIVGSGALLIGGAVALAEGQPYGVWYGLGLPGLVGLGVMGGLLPVVLKRYREAEERRFSARDLG
jgi:hypothetical protein